ncbi:SCO3374 family protein [Streptomyces sp. PTD5-9]|uniref:SCO3374 family protein n=1 Tax=Streptomyces sp. PTD5-9 TaxID=3120150 RepID=UPI00300A8B55
MANTSPPPSPPSPGDGREGHDEGARWARWYEHELGWATEGTAPVRLLTGLLFDVLEVPAVVGRAVLRRVGRTGPVASTGSRTSLLVAAGAAEELPGLLDWLEWRGVTLSLTAVGKGGRIAAPVPPGGAPGRSGAAVWLRPPGLPREGEPALPDLVGLGSSGGDAPDLVRLVDAVASECHRARLTYARAGRSTGGSAAQLLASS